MRCAVLLFFSLFLSLVFLGCTGVQTTTPESANITYHLDGTKAQGISWPDEALQEVFKQYWSSRLRGAVETIWPMEAPYFREMVDKNKYEAFVNAYAPSELTGIEIWSIEPETDHLVMIRCEISYAKNGKSEKFFIGDRWVRVGDKWYHIVHDPILFPSAI